MFVGSVLHLSEGSDHYSCVDCWGSNFSFPLSLKQDLSYGGSATIETYLLNLLTELTY